MAFDISSRFVSPYQFNPLGLNPLRAILAEHVDFAALQEHLPVRLLVGATRVSDGALRIFRDREVTLEAVLASTCLPLMHHAVEIEGDMYWDGGYAANPPLLPLVEASETPAILLVQIVPSEGDGRPRTSPAIVKRLNQMTFHQPLAHDIEAIRAMKRMVAGDAPESGCARKLADLRLDSLAAEDWVPDLGAHSTLDLDSRFVAKLHEAGRAAAADWLDSAPD
jgi:NTE family protein